MLPAGATKWVERPDLTHYLDRAAARLALVDAPAGFGKSTLVAQWRAGPADSRRFAWVSLDRGRAAELAEEARNVLAVLPDGADALRARLTELDRRITGRPHAVQVAEPLTEREIAAAHARGHTVLARDRAGAVRVGEHGQDPCAADLPQARRDYPTRRR
jgi:hypothetical protein